MSTNRYIEIVPTNVPSTGRISFRGGNPVIQFIIGASDHYLLGSSIRIAGDFQCWENSTTLLGNTSVASMDAKTGLYSCFNQLVLKNHGQFSTIEHIKNYNRFLASYLPITSALSDTIGHFSNTALTTSNYNLTKGQADNNGADAAGLLPQNSFSLHLPSGFLLGQQPIWLSEQGGINGLVLELHLESDNNVFHANVATPGLADGPNISDTYYEFSNLKLTAELVEPDAATVAQLKSNAGSSYVYNSISSYYTSVNSTQAIVNFNLGLRNVLGAFANFIPAQRINNYKYNGMETRWLYNGAAGVNGPAVISNLIWTKGGTKFPLNYDVETIQKDKPSNLTSDPQVIRSFIDSVVQFSKPSRCSVSPNNTFYQVGATLTPNTSISPITTDNLWINNGVSAGIGQSYDQVSDSGIDFSRQNFGIQMTCDLTTDNPTGLYLFIHSKQTLVFNNSGLQVIK